MKLKKGGTLVWFRSDLRLADNPALIAAAQRGGAVVPVFIWSPEEEGKWAAGAASRWWLHQSLVKLDASLRKNKLRLIIRKGAALGVIEKLLRETGCDAVVWNRRYEPAARCRDEKIESTLRRRGVEVEVTNGSLLYEPPTIKTQGGKPFQVFTAFWRACLKYGEPLAPQTLPRRLNSPRKWPRSVELAALNLEPTLDWAKEIAAHWSPGEENATRQLRRFIKQGLKGYSSGRDHPAIDGTSRLSPYLHFGEISPDQVWQAVRKHRSKSRAAVDRFCTELGWREFSHHLLFHFPHTPEQPLRKDFKAFPWIYDRRALWAWRRGRTGFPIVDAGMRQLWRIGWMHNRVRMIVASFLVKDLLIPWTQGAAWFWDTLVDADLGNNTLGWQWVAGCGADAAPYFRIFNPTSQGERFDPEGDYVREWVPELAKLPRKWIHRPAEAPPEVLAKVNVELGKTYPRPLVDHAEARKRALQAFDKVKKSHRP